MSYVYTELEFRLISTYVVQDEITKKSWNFYGSKISTNWPSSVLRNVRLFLFQSRVWSAPHLIDQAMYALNTTKAIFEYFEGLFEYTFILPKLGKSKIMFHYI